MWSNFKRIDTTKTTDDGVSRPQFRAVDTAGRSLPLTGEEPWQQALVTAKASRAVKVVSPTRTAGCDCECAGRPAMLRPARVDSQGKSTPASNARLPPLVISPVLVRMASRAVEAFIRTASRAGLTAVQEPVSRLGATDK